MGWLWVAVGCALAAFIENVMVVIKWVGRKGHR